MIEFERDGEVAILRLAHGAVNALDAELCEAVAARFRALVTDPARAVVVTGSGRAFSAGADLRRVVVEGEPYIRRFVPALDELYRSAFELGKPVVAAVNGHAIAGGCVLAACAGITLMSAGRIGVPELAVGVPFPRVALEVLRYAVGDAVTRKLVVGTLTYPVDEARALGLVDEVLPADGHRRAPPRLPRVGPARAQPRRPDHGGAAAQRPRSRLLRSSGSSTR